MPSVTILWAQNKSFPSLIFGNKESSQEGGTAGLHHVNQQVFAAPLWYAALFADAASQQS
jgi:hypothetical protein